MRGSPQKQEHFPVFSLASCWCSKLVVAVRSAAAPFPCVCLGRLTRCCELSSPIRGCELAGGCSSSVPAGWEGDLGVHFTPVCTSMRSRCWKTWWLVQDGGVLVPFCSIR